MGEVDQVFDIPDASLNSDYRCLKVIEHFRPAF